MIAVKPSRPEIYPRLLRRVRAVLIDYIIFVALFLGWIAAFNVMEDANTVTKVAPLLLGLAVLEPGLVAWTGGTIGHHLMGLRIRDAAKDRRIGFLRACVRALARGLLGAVSFLFVLLTRKHQAIHDSLSRTIVVLKRPAEVAAAEKFAERAW